MNSIKKKSQLDLFRNGSGKLFMLKLMSLITEGTSMIMRISTTNDSNHDWCGYPPIDRELEEKEDEQMFILSHDLPGVGLPHPQGRVR